MKFVLGLSGTGKTKFCLDDIAAKLTVSSPLIYIVPEQSSLEAERMLIQHSPKDAIMQVQALSFSRLAYRVFARNGGVPIKRLNDTGKHMLLRRILKDCDLAFYAHSIDMPGFIDNLSKTITEFSEHIVLPSDLEVHALRTKSTLSAKLKDLSLIYEQYKANIDNRFLVANEILDLLASESTDFSYFSNAEFWIDGFNNFTPQEQRVISRIMKAAKNTTVTLTMDTAEIDNVLDDYDFFHTSKYTMRILSELAANLNVPLEKPILLHDIHRTQNPAIKRIITGFHDPQKSPFTDENETVKVVATSNKAAELNCLANWILELTKEGYTFRDIAVMCGDLAEYEKLAKNIFRMRNIPLFVDSKISLMSHPLTELIRAALDIIVWDWQYEGVFRLLKTGFVISQSDIDRLENHVLAYGIKGWRWRTNWKNAEMNDIRLKLLEIMSPLTEHITAKTKATVRDFANHIYTWLYSLNVTDTLMLLLEESPETGEERQSHRQIWARTTEVFDKMVEILGDDVLNLQAFTELLETGLKSTDMGIIPPSLNQVVMGDIMRSRYPKIKALWVLGANDTKLPPPATRTSLITEDERTTLNSGGLNIAPVIQRRVSDRNMALYIALSQPKESLTLSYSLVDSKGRSLRPSPIINKLMQLLPSLQVQFADYTMGNVENVEKTGGSIEILPLSAESVEELYGDKFTTSASKLESYVRCPFSYFLQYNLNARERAIYKVGNMDLGIFYHDILAKATSELTETENWHRASYSDLEGIVDSYAEAAILAKENHVLQSSARHLYILEQIKRVCTVSLWALCRQYMRGAFKVSGIEAKFGESVIALSPTKEMTITGVMDRLDLMDDEYFKIIDYKTGNVRFSRDRVEDGTQIQLLLYANELAKTQALKPAGVFYFNIKDPIFNCEHIPTLEEREELLLKDFKMSGLATTRRDSILGMDDSLKIAPSKSIVIPVNIKRDGDFDSRSSVLSERDFGDLCKQVEVQVTKIGQRLLAGEISPQKTQKLNKTSPCNYCSYKPICGFNRPRDYLL
ncbi:MAG: exodeoxyribonuclease V subunit gamma [Turicibacter sp.]|nr:exodeoxyribonuclease V subunit gamma [Turicibacter sp.]